MNSNSEARPIETEYQIALTGVALADRSLSGRIDASGKDSLDLLNRLSTNELSSLQCGTGTTTVLTSNKGRIIDWLIVENLDNQIIILTGIKNQKNIIDHINFYTFGEELSLLDITEKTKMLCLMGPDSISIIQHLANKDIPRMNLNDCQSVLLSGVETKVLRTDPVGIQGYDLIMSKDEAPIITKAIIDAGKKHNFTTISASTLDFIRIENGIPLYNKELTENHNPLEANLQASISDNKGCYVGQEVIARINTYQKLQRRLVQIHFDANDLPLPGSKLIYHEKNIGYITSIRHSFKRGQAIGLGYVQLIDYQDDAAVVTKHKGNMIQGKISELEKVNSKV
jgi:folate-binding protein YgfZ